MAPAARLKPTYALTILNLECPGCLGGGRVGLMDDLRIGLLHETAAHRQGDAASLKQPAGKTGAQAAPGCSRKLAGYAELVTHHVRIAAQVGREVLGEAVQSSRKRTSLVSRLRGVSILKPPSRSSPNRRKSPTVTLRRVQREVLWPLPLCLN